MNISMNKYFYLNNQQICINLSFPIIFIEDPS
jgi:hypothetical protein